MGELGRPARPWLNDGAAELRRSGKALLTLVRGVLDGALGEGQGIPIPVTEVMSRHTRACIDDDTLDIAASILWENDCGCVPVVTPGGIARVIGMLTDRDICMAAYTTGRRLPELRVASARSRQAWSCASTATVEEALAIMRHRQVHRLPVVDAEGILIGLLSLADVAGHGKESSARALFRGDPVSGTFADIRERRS
jgi:CBS domain-containing protein